MEITGRIITFTKIIMNDKLQQILEKIKKKEVYYVPNPNGKLLEEIIEYEKDKGLNCSDIDKVESLIRYPTFRNQSKRQEQ